MKQYKSDGRYKYYNLGLHYIVEFRWAGLEDKQLFAKLRKVFEEMYGPDKEKVLYHKTTNGEDYYFPQWKYNTEWRFEQNRSAKRRRIYLKEESVLSLALLRIG